MVAVRGCFFLGADVCPGILQVGRRDHASAAQFAQQGTQLKVDPGKADFQDALRGSFLRADAAHPTRGDAKVAGNVTVSGADTYQSIQVDSGGVFHVPIIRYLLPKLSIKNCIGVLFLYTGIMKNGDKFERAVVMLLEERIEARGMSHSDFARDVMGGDPIRSWRLCRAKDGRTRRLRLSEAYDAAEVLGEDFASMMWQLVQEAKKRGLLD